MKRTIKPPKMTLSKDAREYFKKMGAIGGHQRASNMTPEERKASAVNAINARWNKKKG